MNGEIGRAVIKERIRAQMLTSNKGGKSKDAAKECEGGVAQMGQENGEWRRCENTTEEAQKRNKRRE